MKLGITFANQFAHGFLRNDVFEFSKAECSVGNKRF